MLKDFLKNLKNYFSYIMKLGFGELFVQFLILLVIVVISCFIYIPIQLIQDLLLSILVLFIDGNSAVIPVYNVIFKVISTVCIFLGFIYLFNKRYDDVEKEIKENCKIKIKLPIIDENPVASQALILPH